MPALSDWSTEVAALVEALSPTVVSVAGGHGRPNTSGLAWKPEGLFLVPAHALEREEGLAVTLGDGSQARATLAGKDASTDVALLRTQGTLQVAPRAPSSGVRLGEWVVNLSRPGQTLRARAGIVSARAGAFTTALGGKLDAYVETDIVPRPGFSGGVVANSAGQVIGLSTSGLARHAPLVIPSETLERVAAQLETHGRVRRGYLGVGTQPVRLPAPLGSRLGSGSALLVLSVEPGTPADTAGLQFGDAIVAVEGKPVDDVEDLFALLTEDRIGAELPLSILRAGSVLPVRVTVGQRP